MAAGGSSERVVLIAVDESYEAEMGFNYYFDHLHRPENVVIVAHCLGTPKMPNYTLPRRSDLLEGARAHGRERADSTVFVKYKSYIAQNKVKGAFVTDFGKPGEYLVDVATKKKATLVVMGTRGMGTLRRTIMGSVSDYVLHHAHCAVMIYRLDI